MFRFLFNLLPGPVRAFFRKYFSEDLRHTHIVVDLETLGTRPGCIVLQIGAVVATPRGVTGEFLVNVSMSDQELHGLTADEDTLRWWDRQDPVVKAKVFSDQGRLPLKDALYEFDRFVKLHTIPPFGETEAPQALIYGNGAGFDQPILTAAYGALGRKPCWKFYNERCYRTLKNLYPHVEFIKPAMAHDALEDARAEGEHLVRLLNQSEHGWR